MLKTPRKLLLSLVSILLLGACSNTNSSKTLEEEVKTTAAYYDKVPYMSPEGTATKNAVDFPVRAQGDPNDEEGYIDITNPTPQYYLNKYYALNFYDSFDTTLNYAKKIKDKAIAKCKSLNEWTDRYLILFDIGTKELEFYFQEEYESTAWYGTRPVRSLYKSDICKNENGKINYHVSEYKMFLDATDEEPVFQQANVSYLEDSYYLYSQCNRNIEDYRLNEEGAVDSKLIKCKATYLTTYYIDMNYPDLMYCFEIRSYYTLEDVFLSSEIHKYAYDMVNGFEIDYYQDKFSFYGTNGLPLINILRGRPGNSGTTTAFINLYAFSGWDYCYTKSILHSNSTEDNFKFHLSNDNINNVPIHLGVFSQMLDGFAGYPELQFAAPTYESFELYLNQAGLQYTGNSKDLEYIQKFYNNEINFTVFGEDIKTISDTNVSDFVQIVCEDYRYSELEQIINYNSNPIPLSSTVIEASPAIVEVLFEIENNVTIDDKYVHLSGLSVSLKKTPYFKGGNEYECVVELYDSEHDNPETVATTSFTYGVDEKIKFNDIKIEDLPVNIKKGKYYFVLNFNGYTLDIVES